MNSLPKILIVDDDEGVRDTLESLLAAEDLELLFAEDGATGLRMAQEFQPDAILLDVMMPGLDGYETCRMIRRQPALAEIPIIMITALDDRDARLTGLMSGADDFLTKPFDGMEIQIRVKNIMRLNRYRSLVAERSRFYWVVENSEKGYLVIDEAGNIQHANQRAQAYFHLPENYLNLNFDEQAERYYQFHSLENGPDDLTGHSASYLVQPESATARAFWLRVEMLNPTVRNGNQRLMSVTDVTERMSAYQDMRKIHLLVAHKLRTPVALIYSSMTLLDSKMDLLPPDEIKSMVKTAWKGSERLVNEVRDILRYVDAPIALAEGKPARLGDLENLIGSVCDLLEIKDVSMALPAQLAGCKLGISASALELVTHELLDNSRKFHPGQSPHIQVRVEAQDADYVQVHFLDDGRAMTAEQIAQAKQPYSQGEKWFTGEIPGMGLGLPLVATLIWQADGQMRLANRHDQVGICVSLTLPVLKEELRSAKE